MRVAPPSVCSPARSHARRPVRAVRRTGTNAVRRSSGCVGKSGGHYSQRVPVNPACRRASAAAGWPAASRRRAPRVARAPRRSHARTRAGTAAQPIFEVLQRDHRVVRFAEHALHARECLDRVGARAARRQRREEFERIAQPLCIDPHLMARGRVERRQRRDAQMTEQPPHALRRVAPQRRRVAVFGRRQRKRAQPLEPAERQPRIAGRMQQPGATRPARPRTARARRRACRSTRRRRRRPQSARAGFRSRTRPSRAPCRAATQASAGRHRACRATGGRQSAEEAHQRAQAAQRDASGARIRDRHARAPALVAEPLRGDVAGQREQRGALRAHAVQVDGLGLDGPSAAGSAACAIDHARQLHEGGPRAAQFARRGKQHAARRCARAVSPSRAPQGAARRSDAAARCRDAA